MSTALQNTIADLSSMHALLEAHLKQDLGVRIAATFEEDEGTMAGEDAVSFVTEAQRLLRLGRDHGDVLTSGYVYAIEQYFLNNNDPIPTLDANADNGSTRTEVVEPVTASWDFAKPKPCTAASTPRALALLAAMVHVDRGQPATTHDERQAQPNGDTAARRRVCAGPTRVVFQGTVILGPAASPPTRSQPSKSAPAVQCTFEGVQTHVVDERGQRLSIAGPARHELTAGMRLTYEGGVVEKLPLVDASLVAQPELPLSSTLKIGCQSDNCEDPS